MQRPGGVYTTDITNISKSYRNWKTRKHAYRRAFVGNTATVPGEYMDIRTPVIKLEIRMMVERMYTAGGGRLIYIPE